MSQGFFGKKSFASITAAVKTHVKRKYHFGEPLSRFKHQLEQDEDYKLMQQHNKVFQAVEEERARQGHPKIRRSLWRQNNGRRSKHEAPRPTLFNPQTKPTDGLGHDVKSKSKVHVRVLVAERC